MRAKAERHLRIALKIMNKDGSLHASRSDWADHLNQLGNAGAHSEDYEMSLTRRHKASRTSPATYYARSTRCQLNSQRREHGLLPQARPRRRW